MPVERDFVTDLGLLVIDPGILFGDNYLSPLATIKNPHWGFAENTPPWGAGEAQRAGA
jgi:hypothetical protein